MRCAVRHAVPTNPQQTITANLTLTAPDINLLVMKSPSSQAQLQYALSSWLSVPLEKVQLTDTKVLDASAPRTVTVFYKIANAFKDVSEEYELAGRRRTQERRRRLTKAEFKASLNAAYPGTLPTMSGSDVVEVVDPVIHTSLVVQVSLSEAEYELHHPLSSADDSANFNVMFSATKAVLQDTTSIVTQLNSAAGCTGCVTSVTPNMTALVYVHTVPPGKVIASLTTSEAALALAIIIVVSQSPPAALSVALWATVAPAPHRFRLDAQRGAVQGSHNSFLYVCPPARRWCWASSSAVSS